MEGLLSFEDAKADEMKTPIDKVRVLSLDTVMDEERIAQIKGQDFSRIPVSID